MEVFASAIGVFEDPATGSSHCSLKPFWAEKLGKARTFARRISTRGGELFYELIGERVKVGGLVKLYLKGEIFIEEL
ncbi:MAG: hypothetical protein C4324_02625 [Blastocatellia bacterium]